VNDRRRALENEASGENDRESSFAIAINDWICIKDSYKAVLAARNDAISQLD